MDKRRPKAGKEGKTSKLKKSSDVASRSLEETVSGAQFDIGKSSKGESDSSGEESEDDEAEAERGLMEMKRYIDRIDRRLYDKYGTPPRKTSPLQSPRLSD